MFRLMEKARKNDKGFSLVELIVVVLIIAIIAVALAPQVVKYVGKARTSVQDNNIATIKSAAQTAVAEYQGQEGVGDLTAKEYTVTQTTDESTKKTTTVVAPKGDADKTNPAPTAPAGKSLGQLISDNVGTDKLDYNYKINVEADASVTVTPNGRASSN